MIFQGRRKIRQQPIYMKNGKQLYIKAEFFHGQETAN